MAWGDKTVTKDFFGNVTSVGIEKIDGSVSVHEPGLLGGVGKEVASVSTNFAGNTSVTSPGGHSEYVAQMPWDSRSGTEYGVSVAGSVAARLDRPPDGSSSPAAGGGSTYSPSGSYGNYGGDYVPSGGTSGGSAPAGSYSGGISHQPHWHYSTPAEKAARAKSARLEAARERREERNSKLYMIWGMIFIILVIVSFAIWLSLFFKANPDLPARLPVIEEQPQ